MHEFYSHAPIFTNKQTRMCMCTQFVAKLLSKDAAKRFQDAESAQAALEQVRVRACMCNAIKA
jgi:hypothetical protein